MNPSTRILSHLLPASAMALATCAYDLQEPVLDPPTPWSAEDSGGENCPPDECGLNGTALGLPALSGLPLSGAVNDFGAALVGLRSSEDGRLVALDVIDGQLVGLDPESGGIVARDRELLSWELVVRHGESDSPGFETALGIERIAPMASWFDGAGSGETIAIPVYHLVRGGVPLCSDGALVTVGDERYNERTLEVESRPGSRLVTFACAGHMLGKLERMGYASGSAIDPAQRTSAAQRQATLRMLGADYCGTGDRFTEDGVALYWQNRAGWMVHGAPPESYMSLEAGRLEAGWDEHGATCLYTPRLSESFSRADIVHACGRAIPRCTEDILGRSEWTTWNP